MPSKGPAHRPRPDPGPRRSVGLYAPFVDGPLAEVQDYMRDTGRLGRTPAIVEVVEYLYRYWKENRGDQT